MRGLICFFAIFVGITHLMAQDSNTMLQRINEIKKQSDIYYWDQFTDLNSDSAKINATKRLLLEVNLKRSDGNILTVDGIMPYASYINIDRGMKKQYFVYIKKIEADAIVNGVPPANRTFVGTQVSGSAPVSVPVGESSSPASSVYKNFVPDAFVQRILQAKMFTDVYKLLKSMQAQGDVLQFGKLKDVEDYSSLDLILFDMQSQEVITMLSAVTSSGMRTNMVNGSDDSLDNYPTNMTAVIWFIKK